MKNRSTLRLILCMVFVFQIFLLCSCVPGDATVTSEVISTDALAETEQLSSAAPDTEATTAEDTTEEPTSAEEETYQLNEGSPFADLPRYTYDPYFAYWTMDGGAELLLFDAENQQGHAQYQRDLESAGLTLYAENEIAGNLYSTWTNESVHVTLMYLPSLQSVRVLAEPATIALPALEAENAYTDAGYENLIIQIGADYDGATKNGMCYAYRLCDGSFILVDSNFGEPGCADTVYETLAGYAPDPENIVIAAWFITHPHGDHVDGFHSFTSLYRDKVTVEQIIYNYPPERVFKKTGENPIIVQYTVDCCALYEDARIIEAHPGQEFFIRDAYIEMLYTLDLYGRETIDYMNNSSLVFRITLEDTTIMQTGDCGPLATPVVLKLYGEYLDSDFLQVAHHGYEGASAALNQAFNPEVLLYPSNQTNLSRFYWDPRHKAFMTIEHVYLAEDKATVIPLPFDPERVETWELYQ